LDVWTADFGDCYLVMNIRETSFIAMLAPANEDCDDPGIFLGPITVTSPASDSNADSSIIVSYVEVPESAEEQIEIGSSYIFDLYQSGNTLTMRNDHFESSGLWPTGGLDLTRRSSDFDINGIYDGNDTSITYIQNEFYMRLGGFSDEVQSEDDYSGASAGVVEDTSTAGRYTVIPVVDSDGGGDDDDSGAGPSFSVDFSRSGGQLVADVSVSQFDLIFTDRPTDALNGVWYGRDPENGAECIQSTEFFNGIFFAYRFQCNDGIESSSTNLTLAAYIGRYEILPNDQIRLLYSHVINSESGDDDNDISGYEVVFDSVLTSDQLSLTGRFCVGCDPFTITLNQADRTASSMVVDITVDADINTFNVANFVAGLAQALEIPVSTVEVLSVSSGSVVVEVAISEDLSDTDAPDLDEISDRIDAIATGSVSVGGYTVQGAASNREPGVPSSAAGVAASFLALGASAFAALLV